MINFQYARADDVADAVHLIGRNPNAKFIAGGTNLIDLMKMDVERPTMVIDITRLPLEQVERLPGGGLRVGALVRNTDLAYHPLVEQHYPVLASAIMAGASQQLRNMASTGGNLLQRTRCHYFYDTATGCNKREPGSGCSAVDGHNRMNAILGTSDTCIAVHPSDMCVAMAILEAKVHVGSASGDRVIAFADFHRLPGETPERDTNLNAGEIVTAVELPPRGFAENYTYLKIRDRSSYAFALVSIAVGLELDGDIIKEGRFALGGVAHKPWRDPKAEAALRGQPVNAATFARAADILLRDAKGYGRNTFKIELARAVSRAHSHKPRVARLNRSRPRKSSEDSHGTLYRRCNIADRWHRESHRRGKIFRRIQRAGPPPRQHRRLDDYERPRYTHRHRPGEACKGRARRVYAR